MYFWPKKQCHQTHLSPDFTYDEIKCAGQCSDPTGIICEVFINAADGLLLSILAMTNSIKSSKMFPQNWSELWIKTLKKKGSSKSLTNYRGISIVSIISIIFEKLLKNRITPILKQNTSDFQNGGFKRERCCR